MLRNLIRKIERGRSFAARIGENMYFQKALSCHKCHAVLKILLRLTGKAHNHIGRNAHVFLAKSFSQLCGNGGILFRGIRAAHGAQSLAAAALQAQMELRAKLRHSSQAADIVIRQHIRVKAAQADALNARHSRRMFHQLRQARSGIFAIAGQADCRQHNFTVTGCRQAVQFFQNAYFAAAAHRAAGAGNHAISAAAVAAIFYLHKCAGVICKAVHRQFFKAFALLVRANVHHLGFLAVQHFLHILQNGVAVAGTRYHISFFNFSGFFRERLRVTARQNCHRAGVFAFGAAQPFAAFLVAKVRHGAAVDHINIRTVFFFHYGKPILLKQLGQRTRFG